MTPRKLKAWRVSLGMSQAKFGRCLKVSRCTVNRWEGGLQAIPARVHAVKLLTDSFEFGDHQCPGTDDDGQPLTPERATCGNCGQSWCERCDPGPSALCPYCHGRGHSTAPLA